MLYVGSLGDAAAGSSGELLHALADRRCADFNTCGAEGAAVEGLSRANRELMNLFQVGQFELLGGSCGAARQTKERIADLLYVPLVQGVLRYAHRRGEAGAGEKDAAAGAAYAAALLPRVHAADPSYARDIYDMMRTDSERVDGPRVKAALENVYGSLGLRCSDVGGLWDYASEGYYPGMEPCVDPATGNSAMTDSPRPQDPATSAPTVVQKNNSSTEDPLDEPETVPTQNLNDVVQEAINSSVLSSNVPSVAPSLVSTVALTATETESIIVQSPGQVLSIGLVHIYLMSASILLIIYLA